MSVRVEDGMIHLTGRCLAEDAEALLIALSEGPTRIVELSAVQRMHLAVAQILLAVRPQLRGIPDNPFLARHLINLLQ